MMTWEIVAYAYDAAVHCVGCAEERFGAEALATDTAEDREGNPVHPIFAGDEEEHGPCDTCGDAL